MVWLLAAGIYFVLGAGGVGLAIAPGYASPIFPAAGFACAILLWSSRAAWPGVWLGSLALNLGIAALHGPLDARGALVAAAIASGSSTQAIVAAGLVVRFLGQRWRVLESERDIIACLMLAGPVACVVSASTGVSALYAAGIVHGPDFAYSWINWWVGDALGVLVMLPISLTFLFRRHAPWTSRLVTQVLPMAFTLLLVGCAFYAVSAWERAELKSRIDAHGATLAHLLGQRFTAHQEAIAALDRLVEVNPAMDDHQFAYFTRITLQKSPDVYALSIDSYVPLERRAAFERQLQAKFGVAQLQVTERDAQGRMVRAGTRPEYLVVGAIAPLEGNRAVLGYDINSDPVRRDAAQRALRSGAPAVTAPVRLVQEHRDRVGVLVLHPIRAVVAGSGGSANPGAVKGFAVGVVKVDEMVDIAVGAALLPGLLLTVVDAEEGAPPSVIFRSESPQPASSDPYYPWQATIAVADRHWTLRLAPTDAFLRQGHHWAALAVGAGGLMVASLLQILLLVSTGRTAVVQRKVREQTVELDLARTAAEKSAQLLREAVNSIAQGFTIYDPDDRLVHCNEAYRRIYEISRDLIVIGARFEDILRAGALRGQYPAANGRVDEWVAERVKQHQEARGEVIEQQLGDGRWLMVVEFRTPSGYIVGNRIDITERRLAETIIRDRTQQLNAIFNLSPDGFVSFDGAHRVRYVSPAFSGLTGLDETRVMGLDEVAFSQVLAGLCVPAARFAGIAELLAREAGPPSQTPAGQRIELAGGLARVLDVTLQRGDAETVPYVLCFRDVSREVEVDRMKSEFLSTAAHELRTPMASIYGFAEMLMLGEHDELMRREMVTIIYRQSALMASIINELLDLARIEARRGKDFVFERLNVADVVASAVADYTPPDGREPARIVGLRPDQTVSADRRKLEQSVTNLLSNAFKYSPEGGAVQIRFTRDTSSGDPMIGVEITDEGIGMSPEQQARVFERFYRADTSGQIPGTGLGMSIVKEIVGIHGGRIDIRSALGKGTAVTLWLPEAG